MVQPQYRDQVSKWWRCMQSILVDRRHVRTVLFGRREMLISSYRICTMVVQSLAEVLMVMRVWALYNFSKLSAFRQLRIFRAALNPTCSAVLYWDYGAM
jgi:hypothetical protein